MSLFFDAIQLLCHKCHRINCKRGGSYIYSADWTKKKKTTINLKNKYDKCFQYAITVALNYEEIESHPVTVSNIKQFINKNKWKINK